MPDKPAVTEVSAEVESLANWLHGKYVIYTATIRKPAIFVNPWTDLTQHQKGAYRYMAKAILERFAEKVND